jgi:hypothetical protein
MRTLIGSVTLVLLLGAGCGGGSGADDDGGVDPGDDAGATYIPPYEDCAGTGDQPPSDNPICLDGVDDPPEDPPVAVIEHQITTYEGTPAVWIRITFNPTFADNTYGANAVGWPNGHKFGDLTGSDHVTIIALNADAEVTFDLDIDYLSADATSTCGYASLGVSGGEGRVNVGDPSAILAVTTSMDRNLNERGYCDFLTDSPVTDENCTPDPLAPDWDFRVVYEIWIALWAFDPTGFGSAYMSEVHASPAKGGDNTVEVTPGDCPCTPQDIDTGQCDPNPPDPCTTDTECGDNEFCYDGRCYDIVT